MLKQLLQLLNLEKKVTTTTTDWMKYDSSWQLDFQFYSPAQMYLGERHINELKQRCKMQYLSTLCQRPILFYVQFIFRASVQLATAHQPYGGWRNLVD